MRTTSTSCSSSCLTPIQLQFAKEGGHCENSTSVRKGKSRKISDSKDQATSLWDEVVTFAVWNADGQRKGHSGIVGSLSAPGRDCRHSCV